jgi:uncharacterized protein DUF4260
MTSNGRASRHLGLSAPGLILRAEGLAVAAVAGLAYVRLGGGWLLFVLLILAPDLSMAGYLMGPKAGALVYNAVHTYVGPVILAVAGLVLGAPAAILVALIWVAHIGADRLLGFGLKYPTEFRETHLSRV